MLVLGECVSFEPNGVVRLWAGAGEGDRVVPSFVDALCYDVKVCCTECRKTFSRRNNEPTDVLNDSRLIFVVYLLACRFKDIVAEDCIAGNRRRLLQERPTTSGNRQTAIKGRC